MSVSFLSYTNHMRIGLTADSGVVPDGHAGAQLLLQGMVDVLLKLAERVKVPTDDAMQRPGLPTPTLPIPTPIHINARPRVVFARPSSLTDSNSSVQSDQSDEEEFFKQNRPDKYYLHNKDSSESEEEDDDSNSMSSGFDQNNANDFANKANSRQYSSFREKVPVELMYEPIVRSHSTSNFPNIKY